MSMNICSCITNNQTIRNKSKEYQSTINSTNREYLENIYEPLVIGEVPCFFKIYNLLHIIAYERPLYHFIKEPRKEKASENNLPALICGIEQKIADGN